MAAQTAKNPPAVQETGVQSLGWEDALEEGMTTHSGILAWRIPWSEGLHTVHGVAKSRTLSDFFFFERLLFKDWINNCPSRKAFLIFLFFLFPPSPSPPLGHAENSA